MRLRAALFLALLAGCGRVEETPFTLRMLATDPAGGGDASISPDGKRFIITSKRGGNWDLWTFELATARWSRLTDDPADDFEGKWSPDGRSLVFTSTRTGNKDVWLLSLDNGSLRPLTASPEEEEYPAWSPDGRWIFYSGGPWGTRDFFVVPAAGGEPRKLTAKPGWAGACTFAAGGDSLVCHRYDTGSGDLQRLSLDGAAEPLSNGTDWDYKPAESPDGKWVAFSRSREGPSGIWLMPAKGGEARPLTASPYEDRWPTWNAGGDRIFFHRVVDRGTAVKALDRKTGALRTLVGPGERPLQASLDPEGRRLVYCAETGGGRVLRLLDLATRERRTLDTGPGEACFPRFSPDGARIAFAARRQERWEVAVLSADGSKLADLTAGREGLRGLDGPLDWTPDGRRILFQSDTKAFAANLFTVDVATRQIARLTDDGWFDEAPSWTPDGRSVLFMSTRGGDWTWGLFRLTPGDPKPIEVFAGPDYTEKNFPRMGPDGAIVWSSYDDQGIERLVERAPGGKVRVLAPDAGARWPSYAPGGREVVFTTVARQVEYWLAENPFGPGSPLREPVVEPGGVVLGAAMPVLPLLPGPNIGPVHLHQR